MADKVVEVVENNASGGSLLEIGEFTLATTSSTFEVETELNEVHGIVFVRQSSVNWVNAEISVMIIPFL